MGLLAGSTTPRRLAVGCLSALAVAIAGCSGSSGGHPGSPSSPSSPSSPPSAASAFFARTDAVCAQVIPGEIAAGTVARDPTSTQAEKIGAADVLRRGLDRRFKDLSALRPPAPQAAGYRGFLADYRALDRIEDLSDEQAHAIEDHTKPPLTKAIEVKLLDRFKTQLPDLRSYASANGLTHCVANEI